MKQTIHPVADKHTRSGSFKSYAIRGWNYDEGWIMSLASGSGSAKNVWVSGSFESPTFEEVSSPPSDEAGVIEIDPKPIDLSADEKDAILSMAWEWEIWERTVAAGTCMIDSVHRMLELPRDDVLDWFRKTRRDPSVPELVAETLKENGREVETFGPDGFGQFYSQRRLILLLRKDDDRKGHAVLVYENDSAIFDSDNRFKQVGDFLWACNLGYRIASVVVLKEK